MILWAKPIPRPFRLHDTRHTTATLLLAAGVGLYAVARILRHSDPKVTFDTYAHLVPGYLHAQIDRLTVGKTSAGETTQPQPPEQPARAAASSLAAPVLRDDVIGAMAKIDAEERRRNPEGMEWRAWQESNLRPAASKFVTGTIPQRPERPPPSRYAGLALRRLPRTSRLSRRITVSLLH